MTTKTLTVFLTSFLVFLFHHTSALWGLMVNCKIYRAFIRTTGIGEKWQPTFETVHIHLQKDVCLDVQFRLETQRK